METFIPWIHVPYIRRDTRITKQWRNRPSWQSFKKRQARLRQMKAPNEKGKEKIQCFVTSVLGWACFFTTTKKPPHYWLAHIFQGTFAMLALSLFPDCVIAIVWLRLSSSDSGNGSEKGTKKRVGVLRGDAVAGRSCSDPRSVANAAGPATIKQKIHFLW